MTRVAWSLKQDQLQKEIPGITRKKFLYNLSRSSYEKEWGKEYRKPGWGTRILTFLFQISSGRRSLQSAQDPHADSGRWRNYSWRASTQPSTATRRYSPTWTPAGLSCRTRISTREQQPIAGKYKGADEAYAKLVGKLADRQFAGNDQTFARISLPTIRT